MINVVYFVVLYLVDLHSDLRSCDGLKKTGRAVTALGFGV